jgi:2-polyprenyl-3-methyl-5-hydroxy-6-metoxy-1,4-benzoquinol methylase
MISQEAQDMMPTKSLAEQRVDQRGYQQRLRDEARFADAWYEPWRDKLAINPRLFVHYSSPQEPWNIRDVCALWLGKLEGKKLLDYGCGMGEEAMYFAKLGAEVTAIDISPVGIELVGKRAAVNGFSDRVTGYVMDVTKTTFPAESFDIVHGYGILHHVGIATGLNEVRRLLKPGGYGVFAEHMGNSDFIERRVKSFFKIKEGAYTDHEQPVKWDDCIRECERFSSYSIAPYVLFGRLRRHIPILGKDLFKKVDYCLLKALPPLRHFASGVVMKVTK